MTVITSLTFLGACSIAEPLLSETSVADNKSAEQVQSFVLTYIDVSQIELNKQKMLQTNSIYHDALKYTLARADKALKRAPNPVTNKPNAGPSGNLHDYLSIGPYWWPDPTKVDGLPWIRKDGEVNPLTRGNNTDQTRASTFLNDLGALNLAYLYATKATTKSAYLKKSQQLIKLWLIDSNTKMNPHLNFAQGVPGKSTGRPFGIIEWEKISNIITSIELLTHSNSVHQTFIQQANSWLTEYLNWLLTSKIGMQEAATKNNHANWYDYQVLGLMIHLGQTEQAIHYSQTLKHKRINSQINADGAQPYELARTKSINYSSMNLMAFLKVAELADKLGVDLLNHQGPEGQSIKLAVEYLLPYVQGKKEWQYKQLGGIQKAFEQKAYSTLYVANKVLKDTTVPNVLLKNNIQHVKPELILSY